MSGVLPTIPLTPDPTWVREIPFLRLLAGGIVGAGMIIAVAMLAIAAFRVVAARNGWGQADPGEPIKVVLIAMGLGALSGVVAFSFSVVIWPDFTAGPPAPPPVVVPFAPQDEPEECRSFITCTEGFYVKQ